MVGRSAAQEPCDLLRAIGKGYGWEGVHRHLNLLRSCDRASRPARPLSSPVALVHRAGSMTPRGGVPRMPLRLARSRCERSGRGRVAYRTRLALRALCGASSGSVPCLGLLRYDQRYQGSAARCARPQCLRGSLGVLCVLAVPASFRTASFAQCPEASPNSTICLHALRPSVQDSALSWLHACSSSVLQ